MGRKKKKMKTTHKRKEKSQESVDRGKKEREKYGIKPKAWSERIKQIEVAASAAREMTPGHSSGYKAYIIIPQVYWITHALWRNFEKISISRKNTLDRDKKNKSSFGSKEIEVFYDSRKTIPATLRV